MGQVSYCCCYTTNGVITLTLSDTLIFSVAMGGYGDAFRRCIISQENYAKKYGYDYVCIEDSDGQSDLGMSSAWLKIPLMLGALEKGYAKVVFVDADIYISENTEDISKEILKRPECSIFGVLGHSGRINSGMLAVTNTKDARQALADILSRAGIYLPEKSAVSLWGENGQVINALTGNKIFGELDISWNNTYDHDTHHGFRHYTGPMRDLYEFDDSENDAWQKLRLRRFSKEVQSIDRISFYNDLTSNYDSITAKLNSFSAFKSEWLRGRIIIGDYETKERAFIGRVSRFHGAKIHFCHNVDLLKASTNPYIDQLVEGLISIFGKESIHFGVDDFWTKDYSDVDVLHLQWVEVLCNWEKPDLKKISEISSRLDEIKKTTKIVYTLHNIELKSDFEESSEVLMDVICSRADAIIHLSDASIDAFRERYKNFPWAHDNNSHIIRHGSYDCYFDEVTDSSTDSHIKNHIFICGAIRTKMEWQLAQDVCERAQAAGLPVVFTGNVSSSILHWKEKKRMEQQDSPLIVRRHSRIETGEMVKYARSARCFFLPRVDRLNSGVWYLATTFARPCIVPDQMSLLEDQQAVDGLCYCSGDAESAFQAIKKLYEQPVEEAIRTKRKLMEFSRTKMSWEKICKDHAAVYLGEVEMRAAQ